MKHTAIFLGHKSAIRHSIRVHNVLGQSFHLLYANHFAFSDQNIFEQQSLAELQADFLFSFGPLIVKPIVLQSVRVASINFHPAPPKWPGRGSCSMAILAGDTEFGATAHIMHSKIDAGPILRVVRFRITEDDDAITLRNKAFEQIPELVRLVVDDLEQNCWQPNPSTDNWERAAIKKAEALQKLLPTTDDDAETIKAKQRASVTEEWLPLAIPSPAATFVSL